ncbi:piggyBac transposable element-derived protein 4-like [Eriocheir sinensis]|uniref:piggyBac transposable element-derived protein 4-like n=1 Tax=Eriocheir sinensis TaxID=95602 RepID=UPI0021C7C584|nr:piggyBac transposable element-derived protein 4-like [Eriocheir sinensis]
MHFSHTIVFIYIIYQNMTFFSPMFIKSTMRLFRLSGLGNDDVGGGRSDCETDYNSTDSDYNIDNEYSSLDDVSETGRGPFDDDTDSETDDDQRLGTEPRGVTVDDDNQNRGIPVCDPSVFSFAWSEGSDFVPDLHAFRNEGRGLTEDWPCDDQARECDYFRAFVDNEILDFIAAQSNDYYHYKYPPGAFLWPFSKVRQWVDTTRDELIVFFALIMLMPLCKRLNRQEYWRNDNLSIPLFRKYITRDRFSLLSKFLHFADNNHPSNSDPIWKVRDVFRMILSRFSKYFDPFQKMVIDESLVLFKGRLSFKQYIPTKRHRFGIKLFVLCDCETGLVVDMSVYTGKDVDIPKVGKKNPPGMSGAVVMKMMAPYIGEGRILYTDNWSIPALLSVSSYMTTKRGHVGLYG